MSCTPLPAHPSLTLPSLRRHSSSASSPFLPSLLHPCKPGFHISLLSLVADTVLRSLSHPGGHGHTFALPALGILWPWWRHGERRTGRRSPGVKNSAAASAEEMGGRWMHLSFLAPQGHNCEAQPTVSQRAPAGLSTVTQHLLTHLQGLPSLPWAPPCFQGAPPRETTPTLVLVAGPALGSPRLSHLPGAPNSSSCVPSHVL